MAPSYEFRSSPGISVGIPGSGQDKSLKPICLDIAQISACSRTLRGIVNFNFESAPTHFTCDALSFSHVTPSLSMTNFGNSNRNLNENSMPINTGGTPRVKYVIKNVRLSVRERQEKMEQLKKYKHAVQTENDILEKKVAKFKEIILSKSKLTEFLKTLKEIESNS